MVKKVTCSCGQRFGNDEQHRIHALKHGPSTHQRVRGPVTFADAVAAGDGTLHGAIDHWQDRAKTAEARLAELERNEGTLLGMIRHQQDVLRECLPYVNESMAGRRPGRSADDIRAAVKALTMDGVHRGVLRDLRRTGP